jgi:hypothetical protein
MLRRVARVRTNVSDEGSASVIRVKRIDGLLNRTKPRLSYYRYLTLGDVKYYIMSVVPKLNIYIKERNSIPEFRRQVAVAQSV